MDPRDNGAGVLLDPSFPKSPRAGFVDLTGVRSGQGIPLMSGHRDGKAGLMEGLCSQSGIETEENRERDRELDEDPVTAAASLQPPVWLRWKR